MAQLSNAINTGLCVIRIICIICTICNWLFQLRPGTTSPSQLAWMGGVEPSPAERGSSQDPIRFDSTRQQL